VSNQIERLRYYDGEYLRSYDFADEQSYHVEMRRRLNHRLHLHGVVYGLQLVVDKDSPPLPAPQFYSIAPGMALDQNGREIFMPAPYSLSAENVLNRAGLTAGDNELWLCYQERPAGLPGAGYRDCNQKDQNTRFQESFQISLKPMQPTKNSIVPTDCGGVRLGTITLVNNNGWQIVDVKNEKRMYVGIRAQRVVAASEEKDTFVMRPPANSLPAQLLPGYLDVLPGVFARGNMFVKQNLVIGDDFQLDPSGKNLPSTIPDTGNLKVTRDLFLNGDLYAIEDGEWFLLKNYIKRQIPQIKTGVQTITLPANAPTIAPNDSDVAGPFTIQCDLSKVSGTPQVVISMIEIAWQDPATLMNNFLKNTVSGTPFKVAVAVDQLTKHTTDTNYDLTVRWTVDPPQIDPNDATKKILPVKEITFSYLVIFQP
jgi:hypothetical protein